MGGTSVQRKQTVLRNRPFVFDGTLAPLFSYPNCIFNTCWPMKHRLAGQPQRLYFVGRSTAGLVLVLAAGLSPTYRAANDQPGSSAGTVTLVYAVRVTLWDYMRE